MFIELNKYHILIYPYIGEYKLRVIPVQQNLPVILNKGSVSKRNNTTESAGVLNDNNVLCGTSQISFTSGISNIPHSVEKISLDDKLAYALKRLKSCEFLVAANDVVSQASKLRDCVLLAPFLINKISVITDKSLNEILLFAKFADGQYTLFNPNEDVIFLNGFQPVKHNSAVMIDENDAIILSNQALIVKDSPDNEFNVEDYAQYFFKEYDFRNDAKEAARKYNMQKLTQITQPLKKKDAETITFANVGGQKDVIDTIKKRILFPMKYPEVFKNNSMNHGVILYGPPGTGKSLIAEALANESGAAVFKLCATDLTSKYVGESEKNWRNLFEEAKNMEPSIIYIDEFDAIARQRGGIDTYGDKLINQLLSLMSNVEKNKDNVYLIAATNNYGALDPAIMRSGRFGLHLEIKAPDLEGTKEILKIHTKNKPMAKDFDIDKTAEIMYSKKMTGADIAAVIDNSYSNALDRLGFYKSMEEGRFTTSMMNYFDITEADLIKAINNFDNKDPKRNPVGFRSGK